MRESFLRIAALLCMCVFLLGNAHVSFADDLTYTEAYFTRKEDFSGIVEVPGKGPMRYYAQNDPLWQDMAYERAETQSRRPFGDGGCGPTAGAMAIANLVPEEELRPDYILPAAFDKRIGPAVAAAVAKAARDSGVARI